MAATNHVTTTGTGDGSDWANAASLANALASAAAGDQLWIKDGTYTNDTYFSISKTLTLYGSFDGTETSLGSRALTGDSIISGRGVVGCFNITAGDTMMDHMVISNGYRGDGGGIYATGHSSLELVDCRLDSCAMTDGSTGYGGGTYVSGGTLTLTRCTYVNNTGGPGAYYARGFGLYANGATIQMTDSVFTNNGYSGGTNPQRGARGGGFFIYGGTLTATNCIFAGNKLPSQGGGSAPTSGGAGGVLTHGVVAEITDCTFSENDLIRRADGGDLGGGALKLYGSGTRVTMNNCTITDNLSQQSGGAFYVDQSSELNLLNCLVANNSQTTYSGGEGGAFFIETSASVSATNCTFANNTSITEGGCAYIVNSGSLELKNCIMWGNTATTRGADISNPGGSADLSYCILSGAFSSETYFFGTITEANTFSSDPLFASSTDFRVQSPAGRYDPATMTYVTTDPGPYSPAIDSADPADGFANEPSENGGVLNMGAYGNTAQASLSTNLAPMAQTGSNTVNVNTAQLYGELIDNDTIANAGFYYGTGATPSYSDSFVAIYPPQQTGTVFNAFISGLLYNTTYYYRAYATNAYGDHFGVVVSNFVTGAEPTGGGPEIIHVDPAATGSGSGLNWFDACVSLNAGAALVNGPTNTIWMAAGEDNVLANIGASCTIYGGFAGTETQFVDRALSGESILDGDGLRRCISITAGDIMMDHVVISNGFTTSGGGINASGHTSLELVDSRIDGCTQNGSGNGQGGGVRVIGGTLTLTRCEFVNNTGGPSSWYGRGFGLYGSGATVQMTDCVFTNNTYTGGTNPSRGSRGGGFYFHGGTVTATNCVFAGNNVPSQGGGSQPTTGGGAGVLTHSVVAVFTDCTFSENDVIRRADATDGGGGALKLYSSGTKVTMNNCTITDNLSQQHGGAFYVDESSELNLLNCLVANNDQTTYSSAEGGAFFIEESASVYATNCTIAYNTSITEGGGFYLEDGANLELKNCILYTNEAPTRGADISSPTGGSIDLDYVNYSGDPDTAAYVFGTVTKANDLTLDPQFASSTDFHLKSQEGRWDPAANGGAGGFTTDATTSLCIDAGDPADDFSNEVAANGGRINLGAYGNTAEASKTFGVAPIVTNVSYSVTFNQVTMRGELIINDAAANITFYYDYTDKGEFGSWGYSEAIGPAQLTGTVFEVSAAGLDYNTSYVFRCFATNSVGYSWASNPLSFTTGSEPAGGGPEIIHVKTDATGSGSGLNWFDAVVSLNAGAALLKGPTNTIWMAAGEDTVLATIATNASIYGGFAGTETQLVDRALSDDSIINGEGLRRCISITAGDIMMDHMVISNGFTTSGGGINASGHTSLELVDSRIDGCTQNGSGNGQGGGVRVSGGTLILTRCTFVNNTGGPSSWYGRGFGLYAANATAQMTDCVFTNNTYTGGTNPSRGTRGGAFYVHGGTLTATNCTFAGNKIPIQGGGAAPISGGGAGTLTHGVVAEFTDCTFSENKCDLQAAYNGTGGGALRIYDASTKVTMNNCTITDSLSRQWGGGVFVESGDLFLQNCVVARNTLNVSTKQGGGFYITGGNVYATNCTIAANYSTDEGGGFHLTAGSLDLHNCILWTNEAPTRGADISNVGGTSVDVNYSTMSGDTNDSAYVYDGASTFSGDNTQWDNPLFASSTDFHLQSESGRWDPVGMSFVSDAASSPAIDAGDPADDVGDETAPNGSLINRGAYGGTTEASKSLGGYTGTVLKFL
jgi:hypothetical protein